MKNKGFTLIEVLAILIVLSIIAVLGIPKITKSLEKSRKNSAEASALGYVDTIEKQLINNEAISKYTEMKDGIYNVPLDSKYGVKIGGKGPDKGYIEVSEYKVVRYSLTFGKYTITYDGRNRKVEKKEGTNVTVVYSYGEFLLNFLGKNESEIPEGLQYMHGIVNGDKLDLVHRKIIHNTWIESTKDEHGDVDLSVSHEPRTEDLVGIFSTDVNDVLRVPSDITDMNSEKMDNDIYLRHLVDDNGIVITSEVCNVYPHGTICLGSDEITDKAKLFSSLKTQLYSFNKWDSKSETSEYSYIECHEENDSEVFESTAGCYDTSNMSDQKIYQGFFINLMRDQTNTKKILAIAPLNLRRGGYGATIYSVTWGNIKFVGAQYKIDPNPENA